MNDSLPRPLNGRSPDARRALFAALSALAAALLLGGLAPAAHAERADKDKPLNIEADNMTYDDLKQQTVFTGHVVATKGTILIKADKVVVTQDPQGYQFATGTVAPGTPDSKLAYVSNAALRSVSAIDMQAMKVIATIPVGEVPKRNGTMVMN